MNELESVRSQKLLKIGIYLRLSDEDNDKLSVDDDSESIKNQRNLLLDEITKHNDFLLVDEYCDEDLSGAGTYRPEFERLVRDCELGKLDIVLCKSQSRFSRDMEIIEKYLHNKFIEWNVRFISLSDNADTANAGNKKSRQINGLVNEWYLEDVSNNIKSAFYTKMKQGEYISPFASYGYEVSKVNNNKLIIDPVASEIVRDIFDLYLTGHGFTGIAKYLNSKKIPCPSLYKLQKGIKLNIISNRPREEIKWTTNAIKTILTNELYLGHLIQGKRTTVSYKNRKIIDKDKKEWVRKENTHEAVIDKETFCKVQIAMKERTKPLKTTGLVHNFSGKVFCLECERYLRKKNNTRGQAYLVCSNNRDGYNDCINKSYMRYDTLEEIVLNAINEIINQFYDKERLKQEDRKNKKSRFGDKINALAKQKLDIESKLGKTRIFLKNLYEDKVNGIITVEQFKDLISDYNNNENIYKDQIDQVNKDIQFYKVKENTLFDNDKIFSKYRNLDKLNRIIMDEFIEKIFIGKINLKTNTRNIQIKWNFE